tara:strand:+ start:525 stop:839 length:315 start_codon:yes stop_codon:yes gene_type:complete
MIPEERIRPKGYYSFKSTLETMQTVFTKDKDYEIDTYTGAMEDILDKAQKAFDKGVYDREAYLYIAGLLQVMYSYSDMHKSIRNLRNTLDKYPTYCSNYYHLAK